MNEEVLNLKSKKCLKCEAHTNPNDDKEYFCSKCGAPVLNICANYSCQALLSEDAYYCKICGAPSLYNNYGLFNPETNRELPF